MATVQLQLPYPPTVNHYWGNRIIVPKDRGKKPFINTYISAAGVAYRVEVCRIVAERWPRLLATMARVAVRCVVVMPDRRERDLDNLPKGIFDALSHAGFWKKDSQVDHFSFTRSPRVEGPGWVDVEIERLSEEPAKQLELMR